MPQWKKSNWGKQKQKSDHLVPSQIWDVPLILSCVMKRCQFMMGMFGTKIQTTILPKSSKHTFGACITLLNIQQSKFVATTLFSMEHFSVQCHWHVMQFQTAQHVAKHCQINAHTTCFPPLHCVSSSALAWVWSWLQATFSALCNIIAANHCETVLNKWIQQWHHFFTLIVIAKLVKKACTLWLLKLHLLSWLFCQWSFSERINW